MKCRQCRRSQQKHCKKHRPKVMEVNHDTVVDSVIDTSHGITLDLADVKDIKNTRVEFVLEVPEGVSIDRSELLLGMRKQVIDRQGKVIWDSTLFRGLL